MSSSDKACVFNADMRLSMLIIGSWRNSGNEYPDDQTRDREHSTTKTCCNGVVAWSADDSWLTATASLTARNVRCTHAGCGPLGVFHPCLWPLKAPGCTSWRGRQASHQPPCARNGLTWLAKTVTWSAALPQSPQDAPLQAHNVIPLLCLRSDTRHCQTH